MASRGKEDANSNAISVLHASGVQLGSRFGGKRWCEGEVRKMCADQSQWTDLALRFRSECIRWPTAAHARGGMECCCPPSAASIASYENEGDEKLIIIGK